MKTIYDTIETVARDLYWTALKDIPDDIRAALKGGLDAERKDGNSTAEQVLFTILENIKTADEHDTLVCQDTGLPVYKVVVGTKAAVHYPLTVRPAEAVQVRLRLTNIDFASAGNRPFGKTFDSIFNDRLREANAIHQSEVAPCAAVRTTNK